MVHFGVLYFFVRSLVSPFGGAVVRLFWDLVFEFLECLVNVSIHADAYSAFLVIPFEVHPDVLFGFPVNFEWVFCTDTGYEMINVLFVSIFDTKAVNHEDEGNVSCVREKGTFSTWGLVISEFFQV